jgi:tripartite-type tricarboxylate transporter receptor subunit TctC
MVMKKAAYHSIRRPCGVRFAAILAAVTVRCLAVAQPYPSNPIKIMIPMAPNGPSDHIAREVGEGIRSSTGGSIIFENNLAAGGSIAIGRAAQAAPDGYTLSFGSVVTHVFNAAAYQLQYDVVNDFAPISLLPYEPFVIAARNDMPADDLKGLIALLKRNPGKFSAGTSAIGSLSHAATLHFQQATGTQLILKYYRGIAPALQACLTGETDILIESAVTVTPHLPKLKLFVVMAKNRYTGAPQLPTVDEAGSIGLYASLWRAFWVPKNTSSDIVGKLNRAVVQTLANQALRSRFASMGQEIPRPEEQLPDAIGVFHRAEADKWWPILKAANIIPP